ncbi:MAG: efflux RND transporter periplasmic adaptor subunit [Desulfobacterales bacterium]
MILILRVLFCSTMIFFFPVASVLALQNYSFDGLIEPSEVVKVGSQVSSLLAEIIVERGDRVKKGQVLARLNSKIERAAVDLALARMEFSKRKVSRNEELYRKKLISIHDKDEMGTELRISELQLREAQEKLEIRTIRSPINGVVVERFLSPGEYVGEEAIMKIARINPLYVEVVVPVEVFGKIKKGMRAEVWPEFPGSRKYSARVIIVDKVIDAASGTFGVRLELPNPDYLLPAGLKCKVVFTVK